MREVVENKVEISKQEARDLVERCLKVLYYRDARSYNRVSPAAACVNCWFGSIRTKHPVPETDPVCRVVKEQHEVEQDVQRSSDLSAFTLFSRVHVLKMVTAVGSH